MLHCDTKATFYVWFVLDDKPAFRDMMPLVWKQDQNTSCKFYSYIVLKCWKLEMLLKINPKFVSVTKLYIGILWVTQKPPDYSVYHSAYNKFTINTMIAKLKTKNVEPTDWILKWYFQWKVKNRHVRIQWHWLLFLLQPISCKFGSSLSEEVCMNACMYYCCSALHPFWRMHRLMWRGENAKSCC